MNFIPVNLSNVGFQLADGQAVRVSCTDQTPSRSGPRRALWGVRPEHFSRSFARDSAIISILDVVQPTQSRLYGSFSIAGQRVAAEIEADAMVGANSNLALEIAISCTAFFDPSSGLALATS